MGEGSTSGTQPPVPAGMRFSGVDDAIVEALNYPAVLPGRQKRRMRKVDLLDLNSRIERADLGFTVGSFDHRGRLASRQMFRLLNWLPGTRLASSVGQNFIVLKVVPDGQIVIDGQSRVRLPMSLLHYCNLTGGSSTLIVAVPDHNMLMVHPLPNVVRMIRGFHSEQLLRMMRGQEGGKRP